MTLSCRAARYEVFPFLKYNLLRGNDPASLSQIGILPNTITRYSDKDHPEGKLYYQIQVEKPNPVKNLLSVQFPNPGQDEYQILMTDLSGKVLKIINEITSEKVEISLGDLSDGMYMIELRGSQVFREIFFKE